MTEEEKFAKILENDDTFWGRLFRDRNVTTMAEAKRVEKEFCTGVPEGD